MTVRLHGVISNRANSSDIYTLLGTARLNGVEPETLAARGAEPHRRSPLSRIKEFLPWNMVADLQSATALT